MAKVFPYADLPPRDGDLPLENEQLLGISFLARLTKDRREKLLRFPGAMRLRHVQRGQVICRQGEEGVTAFFILRGVDCCRVRDQLNQASVEATDDDKQRVESVLAEMGYDRRQVVEVAHTAERVLLGKQQDALQTLEALRKSRTAADTQLKKLAADAEKAGDKARGTLLKQMGAADPAGKAKHAVSVQAQEPDLAKLLNELADAEPKIKLLEKDAEFYRTATAEEKRKRAKEIVATNPALAEALLAAATAEDKPAPVGLVHLTTVKEKPQPRGWVQGLYQRFFGGTDAKEEAPLFIPSDGPADIVGKTGQAELKEGDLFGEMACLNRRPRSATVLAQRGAVLLEMLSHVLEEIDKDPDYQKERERLYRDRVLGLHLRGLALFRDLSETDYGQIIKTVREKVELVSYTSGQVICDEHDRSDSLYLIRDGLVQVIKGASALLRPKDILNWSKLTEPVKNAAGPAGGVVKLLPAKIAASFKEAPEKGPPAETQPEIVEALNDVIKGNRLLAVPEGKAILESEGFRTATTQLPEDRKTWTESHVRHAQRRVLEAIFPGALAILPPQPPGGNLILNYLSRGDFFGEIGLIEKTPRTATCVAYGQPRIHTDQKDLGRVEMVRLSKEVFDDLVGRFPVLGQKISQVAAARLQRTAKAVEQHAKTGGADAHRLADSEVSRLGLVQGQQLMLIDLERCTRCDECVKACVDSHSDGRTRLYLTGPRFDKYLVPQTCRSCRDPVCMIGCPVRSIQRGDNLEIQIKDWCIGCEKCAKQCPYDSIRMHPLAEGDKKPLPQVQTDEMEVTERAVVCDLCSSLPNQEPSCVYACPHDAAMRVDFQQDFMGVR